MEDSLTFLEPILQSTTMIRYQHPSVLSHCWIEPLVMPLHRASCHDNWFLSALWPALRAIWLADCYDRHCADSVSVRARALARAAWSAVCAHTHTFDHQTNCSEENVTMCKDMCTSPYTRCSSIHTSYTQLYNSWRVYVSSSIFAVVTSLLIHQRG